MAGALSRQNKDYITVNESLSIQPSQEISPPTTKNSPWLARSRGYLFIALGFSIPLSAAAISIFFVLIFLLWLAERDYCTKLQALCKNPVYVAIIAFFVLHLAGQYWTTEPINSFKNWMLFLVPVLTTSVDKVSARRGVYAFAWGMMVAETGSYYKIFSKWETYSMGQYGNDIYVAMGHISYNPVLAVAIALLLTTLLAGQYRGKQMILPLFFLVTMVVNMFMTGGRAGHVGFMFAWMVLTTYFFWRKPVALITMAATLFAIIWTAYNYSPIFQARANAAVSDVQNYEKNPKTSVGYRLTYAEHSWEIFTQRPWIGHGTGAFESAYKEYRKTHPSPVDLTANPHNNHLLILVQFGLLGAVFYGAIFVTQLLEVRRMPNSHEFRAVALLLPLFFIVVSFYDSYLWGHYTQALFAYLTAVFYRRDLYEAVPEH